MKYINADSLMNMYKDLEMVARGHLADSDPMTQEYTKWLAIVNERVDIQKDIQSFPGFEVNKYRGGEQDE